MSHVVLLGDSIFDNAAYVAGGPDVIQHLRNVLPENTQAKLLAVDGSVVADASRQLDLVPIESTHLVISAGGNDALRAMSVFGERASSVAGVLLRLADIREAFAMDYRGLLDSAELLNRPLAVCTIYNPRFPDLELRRAASTGLAIFNDVIIREASVRGLRLIDLRLVMTEEADFANPIEPSVQGGKKIALAIVQSLDPGGAFPKS